MRYMRSLFLIGVVFICTGCPEKEPTKEPLTEYKPVLMDREEMNRQLHIEEPQPIGTVGKIYQKGDFLFISERFDGIHVINNENPSNPEKIGFIRIPGSLDMAIKGSTLYADNATDLIAIDVSDPNNIEVKKRISDVFPEFAPPDDGRIPEKYQKENRPDGTVLVKWEKD